MYREGENIHGATARDMGNHYLRMVRPLWRVKRYRDAARMVALGVYYRLIARRKGW